MTLSAQRSATAGAPAALQRPRLGLTADAGSDLAGRLSPVPAAKRGAATVWALAGLFWCVIAGQAAIRWVASDSQSRPAPIQGPDEMSDARMVALRCFEVLSSLVLVWFLWYCVIA